MLKPIVLILIAGIFFPGFAQNKDDEAKIRAIAATWQLDWNKHDMRALFTLVTKDADFVNVGGKHWKGRKEIEAQHTLRLSQFTESIWANNSVTVQFLKPDTALAHVNWSIRGDKDPDGTPRNPREGIFTWLLLKKNGKWLIRSAQNTNVSNLPLPVSSKPAKL